MRQTHEIDMRHGPLLGKILLFSVPLMCSGVLQLLFNAADIVVIGQFTGSNGGEAMAAVGSTSSLNTLIVNLFVGLSVGSNVLMARYYGARDWEKAKQVVHTSILLAVASGCALLVIGLALSAPVLRLMGTPENVLDQAVLYMRIIFVGMPAQMVYDFGAGLLRGVGDTRRPLIFLLISGVINVILNLIFVIVFHMGVAGVALATILSQTISAVLVVRCLMQGGTPYQLSLRKLCLSRDQALQMVRIGVPAGMQGAVFAVSNVVIQSSVNSFGSVTVAGNTAAANLEGFVYTAMNAFYQASLNFTSQNVGARNYHRVIPILLRCLTCVFVAGAGLGLLALTFARTLLGIYNSDPAVISAGLVRMGIIFLTYYLCGMMDVTCGSLRGMGYGVLPTVISVAGACGLRLLWIATIFSAQHTLEILYLSYPVSWGITLTAQLICFAIAYHKLRYHRSAGAVSMA